MNLPKFNKKFTFKNMDSLVVSWMGATAIVAFLVLPSINVKTEFKLPLSFTFGIIIATLVHKKEIFE